MKKRAGFPGIAFFICRGRSSPQHTLKKGATYLFIFGHQSTRHEDAARTEDKRSQGAAESPAPASSVLKKIEESLDARKIASLKDKNAAKTKKKRH